MVQPLSHFSHFRHGDYKSLAHQHILGIEVCKHLCHKLSNGKGHSEKQNTLKNKIGARRSFFPGIHGGVGGMGPTPPPPDAGPPPPGTWGCFSPSAQLGVATPPAAVASHAFASVQGLRGT